MLSGGAAHHSIKPYVDSNFGLRVISEFINLQEDKVKLIKERNVVGAKSGSINVYKDEKSPDQHYGFGKLNEQVIARVDVDRIKKGLGVCRTFINQ